MLSSIFRKFYLYGRGELPRLLLSLSESIRVLESCITLATSPLAATMADDESDKDNGPVGCGSLTLSFTAKYLYNDINILANSSRD